MCLSSSLIGQENEEMTTLDMSESDQEPFYKKSWQISATPALNTH